MEAKEETKAALFVQAYIETGFNASAAARKCFNIGSRGGKDPQRIAESMGSEYLRKPEVRRILAEHLKQIVDPAYVLTSLVHLSRHATYERDKLKSLDLIGKTLAMFTDKHEFNSKSLFQLIADSEANAKPVDWEHPNFEGVRVQASHPLDQKLDSP